MSKKMTDKQIEADFKDIMKQYGDTKLLWYIKDVCHHAKLKELPLSLQSIQRLQLTLEDVSERQRIFSAYQRYLALRAKQAMAEFRHVSSVRFSKTGKTASVGLRKEAAAMRVQKAEKAKK